MRGCNYVNYARLEVPRDEHQPESFAQDVLLFVVCFLFVSVFVWWTLPIVSLPQFYAMRGNMHIRSLEPAPRRIMRSSPSPGSTQLSFRRINTAKGFQGRRCLLTGFEKASVDARGRRLWQNSQETEPSRRDDQHAVCIARASVHVGPRILQDFGHISVIFSMEQCMNICARIDHRCRWFQIQCLSSICRRDQ